MYTKLTHKGLRGDGLASEEGPVASISALIILCHFTLGVFLADRRFSIDVILKSPPFYAILISIILSFFFKPEISAGDDSTTYNIWGSFVKPIFSEAAFL